MGLHRGRAEAAASVNEHVVRQLRTCADKRQTGAVVVTDQPTGQHARLFCFEGGLYAAQLTGYPTPVLARLTAAGSLDPVHVRQIESIDPAGEHAGSIAIDQGWADPIAIGTTHQEFLLAALGAVLMTPSTKVRMESGETTALACTTPVPIADALASTAVRRDRLASDWAELMLVVSGDALGIVEAEPATLVLGLTGGSLPTNLTLPEFTAVLAACDGQRSIDEVAWECGFTRAEAVHLVRILVARGVLAAVSNAGVVTEPWHLRVPEEFPVRVAAAPPAPLPEMVPAEEPEVLDVPEPVSVVETFVVAEPVVEPPLLVEEPVEPAVEPSPKSAFDIAALRAELASAERWVDEIRRRLAQAEDSALEP